MSQPRKHPRAFCAWLLTLILALGASGFATLLPAAVLAQEGGSVPGNTLGTVSDAEVWRQIRDGGQGTVSIPDQKAAVLVQSEGDNWRAWRDGPIAIVGAVAFWVMFFVVLIFYLVRGRVRIQHGRSGRTVLRFSFVERFAHWLTAGSFILLAITGVNMLYGKHLVMPIIGQQTFATLTQFGKYVHNFVGFAFIVGLVLIFVLWVRDNLLDRYDWGWIKKGGGLLFPTEHPAAEKFNFGQKTVFWAVILGGVVLSFTGLNLMFPFVLFDIQQMQWVHAIHSTVSQVLCMMMVAHIYIGTVGMEDAFHAMTTGNVDENWAKEHHRAWYERIRRGGARTPPASPTAPPPAHPAAAE